LRGSLQTGDIVVRDDGRLATITSDPPEQDRGITVSSVYVRPDGGQLGGLARLLAAGQLEISVATSYELLDAADALATAVSGRAGGAVALTLSNPRSLHLVLPLDAVSTHANLSCK
jgi:hypothetical protein